MTGGEDGGLPSSCSPYRQKKQPKEGLYALLIMDRFIMSCGVVSIQHRSKHHIELPLYLTAALQDIQSAVCKIFSSPLRASSAGVCAVGLPIRSYI